MNVTLTSVQQHRKDGARHRLAWLSTLALLWWCSPGLAWAASTESIVVSGFGTVAVYAPAQEPSQVVLFVSGDGGWNLGVIPMAEALRDRGALVVGIDIRQVVKTLNSSSSCAYPAGDLERLSRTVQLKRRLSEYKAPILVGYSSGATLVYAALAAAPPETFSGAISLGFCPDLEIARPLCEQNGLSATRRTAGFDLRPNPRLQRPWMVLQGEADQVCAPDVTRAFVAAVPHARLFALPKVGHGFAVTRNWQQQYLDAYDAIVVQSRPASPGPPVAGVGDLPLVEVPAAVEGAADTMAIFLSGDGGWAALDKSVAAGLAERGIPVVGWNSLRYYWTPRTPQAAAADLARTLTQFVSRWSARHVIVIGYSFGADVLPFLVNRLPPELKSRVSSVALLGPSDTADFEFHVSDWISNRTSAFLTVPEAERLNVPLLCVHGTDEEDSACGKLHGPLVRSIAVGSGHHFSGNYAQVVNAILGIVRPSNSAAER